MKEGFRMRTISRIVCLFVVTPLVIGVQTTYRDSSETSLRIAGGAGSYAHISRGCEGKVLNKEKVPFKDAGFSLEHKFNAPVKLGLRGGYISENQIWYSHSFPQPDNRHRTNFYLNPNFSFESEKFGIGAGPFFADKDLYSREGQDWGNILPSAHVRLGAEKLYLSANLMENVPLYSGGGYFDFGVGTSIKSFSLWVGVNPEGPYDSWGALLKTDFRFHKNWNLGLNGRLGAAEGISESAISVGIMYRLTRTE
jgi:hypothetical protein